MRFASLGSGSRGNATLVEGTDSCLLIDCGFTLRQTLDRLDRIGVAPDALRGILVTHEHGDHARGVLPLARRFGIPVHTTIGTAHALDWPADVIHPILSERPFDLAGLRVQPVAVPHDAREPVQFVFTDDAVCLGVLTDAGHVSGHIRDCYAGCDALLIEYNHDRDLLANGPYPPVVKRRVAGPLGHLSNEQSNGLVGELAAASLTMLAIGHVSEQNNSEAHVRRVLGTLPAAIGEAAVIADQESGLPWQTVFAGVRPGPQAG